MTDQVFQTPGEVFLRVDNKAGPVQVGTHARPTTEVTVSALTGDDEVAGQTRVDHTYADGRHRIVVEVPARGDLLRSWRRRNTEVLVAVRLPEGAAIEIKTASGDVTADGRFGAARVGTASGRVWVERAEGELGVHTASGEVVLGSAGGEVTIRTASGDVRCDALEGHGEIKTASGDATVHAATTGLTVVTASGDVSVGDLAGESMFKSASGDQRIGRLIAGRAQLDTVTGDLTVGIARGAVVAVDAETVSGTLDSEIDLDAERPLDPDGTDGPPVALRARTVSGDLRVRRAEE
jgi:DUF4097 and DUF4098 domain-containing protein YvlB